MILLFFALFLFASSAQRELPVEDRAMLRSMQYDYADEAGGFEAGYGQPHSMIVTLLNNERRMICKNGRLAFFKMDQLLNEVYAFYLDRLLNIGLIPPATVSEFSGRRFKEIRDRPVPKNYWKRGDPMVCSAYIDDASPAILPKIFRNLKSQQISVPFGEKRWNDKEKREAELWGSVILLDFMMGNMDRLAVSLDTAASGFKQRVKRSSTAFLSLSKCRHEDCHVENALVDENGKLHLVDNNSGFFYDRAPSLDALAWILEDMCVFPQSLLKEFSKYQDGSDLQKALNVMVAKNEPEGPRQSALRQKVFMMRFDAMMRHIENCRQQYGEKLSFF